VIVLRLDDPLKAAAALLGSRLAHGGEVMGSCESAAPPLESRNARKQQAGLAMSDEFMLDTDDLERRMNGAIASLRTEFASLRTGRGSASMLEPVMVEAYGQMTPVNQVGTVNVPEPRMVTINVWDKGLVGKVEKAIRESGLGINPQLNGTIIMLPIPELNEERRTQLTKVAGQYAEHARVSIRNIRRDGMDQIKKAKNDGAMSEDDQKIWEGEVQDLTNRFITLIDDQLETKQAEIMQV
jgi:ribosome recycling factor